jgi:hypothetical protein
MHTCLCAYSIQHTCIHACLRTYGCVHVSCYKASASKLITVLECESTRPHALLSDLPYRCLHRHTPENTLALCLQHTCMPAYIHRTYMQHACMHTYIHACRHTYAHQITNPCATSTAAVSLFLHGSFLRTVRPCLVVSLVRERAWFKAEDEQLSAGSRFLHGRRAVKAEAQNQPFQSDRGRHSTSLWNS